MMAKMMRRLNFDPLFQEKCPDFHVGVVTATVSGGTSSQRLISAMEEEAERLKQSYIISEIKNIAAISKTRAAYKHLGKDPNRYRPAAEQLSRRVIKGLPLYYINTLVDIGNLLSLQTGYSIGVFDRAKVGNDITLGIGREGEAYIGIGRGELNIEHLPVYRDENGAFATPTSDHERTSVSEDTHDVLIFINDYGVNGEHTDMLEQAIKKTKSLLEQYTEVSGFSAQIIHVKDDNTTILEPCVQ